MGRPSGDLYDVFLLSYPGDAETLRLDRPIRHEGVTAWTHGQRYVRSAVLRRSPETTSALDKE
jgi:hypothetical protein